MRAEILVKNKAENAKLFKNLKMGGHMSGALTVNWKARAHLLA